jgi:hypothetical protein
LSHPHDGYDPGLGQEINAGSPDYGYVFLRDESATTMGYIRTAFAFSQFDRDAVGRWSTASYLTEANRILHDVQASARAHEVQDRLQQADADATHALSLMHTRQFTSAATLMAQAYDQVVAAANVIGVPIAPAAYRGQTQPRGSHNYNPLTAPNALSAEIGAGGPQRCGC